MNKTLLLFIVDFLFLNLIALTRWESAEPVRPVTRPAPSSVAANAPTSQDQDLVDVMRQSLADEELTRQDLERKLSASGQTLAQREQNLSAAQSEQARLSAALGQSQQSAAELGKEVQVAQEETTLTKDQIAQLERELADKAAEAERQQAALAQQQQALAQLQKEQADSGKKIEALTMAVVVGESEKQQLKDQTVQLQDQVQTERAERIQVQASTAKLAQGVGQLAEQSGALTQEIRSNRPINANVLYSDFLANRVQTDFTASRKGLFGEVNRSKQTPTVFVTDGTQVYAILHIEDTVFSYWNPNYDWDKFGVSFDKPSGYQTTAGSLKFLSVDPRVVAVPVDASQVAALGAKVYPLATDPFKFPDAVLISGDKGYGEVGFKLDPSHPGYVKLDNRFFKRLFGDFSPSRGDLVFSHTGEFLGLMVNNTYCALVRDFSAVQTLPTGDDVAAEKTASLLDTLGAHVQAMPPGLQ
jgi:hypothetical protein